MQITPYADRLSPESLLETSTSILVPPGTEEQSKLLSIVLERLLHPQCTSQVFSDILLLNSLTREYLAEEKRAPLAYAQRRLAVFELGLQAMLVCADFEPGARNSLFEIIVYERESWDSRVWELLLESGEYSHRPIGFNNQKV